ncbi:MAG: hypothetical protein CM15mV51_0720 [uncultured marine virus]|nr:MAG: hypothetical protein CM15mV51_0720 [uncultured marine virus]
MSTGNDPGVGIMDTRDLGMGVKGLKNYMRQLLI